LLSYLVEQGADLSGTDKVKASVILLAARGGRIDVLDWCVAKGLDVSATDRAGDTLLHFAARGGSAEALDWCVEHGLKADALTSDGRSAVHEAATGGHVAALDWCVEHGLKADALDSGGWSAVHLAALGGSVAALDWCVEHGLKADALTSNGWSAVHIAANDGHVVVLDWFMKNGHHAGFSRPFVPPAGSNSAVIAFYETCRTTALQGLHDAIASKDDETVRRHVLAFKKCDRNPSAALMSVVDGNDAFSIAASSDNTLAFQAMGAACEVEPSDMPPILVCCAVGSSLAVARLAGSTDVDAVLTCSDGVERTPLDVAVAYGQVGMITFLMGLGASRLHLHTQSDLYRVLGRCRASVMVIGRFQSGKSLLTEYLCSFERKLKLGPITVRPEKRPKAIARQEVEQGVDTGATDGFDTHDFSVDVSAKALAVSSTGRGSSASPSSRRSSGSRGSPAPKPRSAKGSVDVTATVFDFGGQDTYRHFHPLFFTMQTLYIVLFSVKRLVADPAGVQRECFDWIQSIRPIGWRLGTSGGDRSSSEGAPRVFLVGTHWDTVPDAEQFTARAACNKLLDRLRLSCNDTCESCSYERQLAEILNNNEVVTEKQMNAEGVFKVALAGTKNKEYDKDIKRLRRILVTLSLNDPRRTLLPSAAGSNRIADVMEEELAAVDSSLSSVSQLLRRLDSFDFGDADDSFVEKSLTFYRDSGRIYFFIPSGSTFADVKFIVLSPQWLSKCLARLVRVATAEVSASIGAQSYQDAAECFVDGVLHIADAHIVWQEVLGDKETVSADMVSFFMEMLVNIGVAIQLEGEDVFLFPTMLTGTVPEEVVDASKPSLAWNVRGTTAAERVYAQLLLQLEMLRRRDDGLARLLVDRFKDGCVVQDGAAASLGAPSSTLVIQLDGADILLLAGSTVSPFRVVDGKVEVHADDKLVWTVIRLIDSILGDSMAEKSVCSCDSVECWVPCPQCSTSASREMGRFSLPSIDGLLDVLKDGELPPRRNGKPHRCVNGHAVLQLSHLFATDAPIEMSTRRPVLQRMMTVGSFLDLPPGSPEYACSRRMFATLENVLLSSKSVAGGYAAVRHEGSKAETGIRVLGKLLSLTPIIGGMLEVASVGAAAGLSSLQNAQRERAARLIAETPYPVFKRAVDAAVASLMSAYEQQVERLVPINDVRSGGALQSHVDAKSALLEGAMAVLNQVSGDLVSGIGGKGGTEQATSGPEIVADFASAVMLEELQRCSVAAEDVTHYTQLGERLKKCVLSLQPTDGSDADAASGKSQLRALIQVARSACKVYVRSHDGGDVVLWSVADFFTRPGIVTASGDKFGDGTSGTLPAEYGLRKGTKEEAIARGMVSVG
jgi:GTPase SAR1 family protein